MFEWQPAAKNLAASISQELTDPVWRDVFTAVPRHVFTPRFWVMDPGGGTPRKVTATDPEWAQRIYRDELLVVQYQHQDGQPIATCSASEPSLVARMLHLAQIGDGNTVIEIGTGTGYTAALLCHRLGDQQVFSVEHDPVLAAAARLQLAALGHQPQVYTGDGTIGIPGHSVDRIIATCAVGRIPPAWIDQLHPGGLIVTPLLTGGGLVALRKTAPGQVSGTFDPQTAYFMALRRPGDPPQPGFRARLPPQAASGPAGHTTIPEQVWDDQDWLLWLGLHKPGVQHAALMHHTGITAAAEVGLIVYTHHAAATVAYRAAQVGPWPVEQDHGRLWDDIEQIWESWCQAGRPQRHRIGLTASNSGHTWRWVDTPNNRRRRLPEPEPGPLPAGLS